MNSINEIFGIYFYRKQFNDLVQKLRDKGCLNEESLEKVIKYRKRSIIFYRVCLYSLVFPALFFLGYLFYLFLTNFDGLIRQGVANICIQVFGAAFIVCLYIWGKIECVQKEWRYVYLATLGKRNTGRVLSFVGVGGGGFFGDIEKLCVYDFYDENGHSYIVKSRQPTEFYESIAYQKGDRVNITYDRKNPKNSIVVSLKMEMFNLRKRKLPAATDRGEALDQGAGD